MSAAHTWLRGDGMSVREVARALRLSVPRVQQLEKRALEKLRNCDILLQHALEAFEVSDRAKEDSKR